MLSISLTYNQISVLTSIYTQTIIRLLNSISTLLEQNYEKNMRTNVSNNILVEIDEPKIGKRKYNRGILLMGIGFSELQRGLQREK